MFIHEMTDAECRQTLERLSTGRLACARDNQPYAVPITFAFDGDYLYGFTTVGQKVEWMRLNPLVCFETDEVVNECNWTSIIIFGKFEELSDAPEHETARLIAHELLQKRAMWWEPAYLAQRHRNQSHSLTPVFYRIHIEQMTGHRATPNGDATVEEAPDKRRGWLEKLLDPQ
jgi:nitroimidazol reductase NimA-like FMN-containing flavoprotein (pyridoxamine 5'-phosphate oxidase superfamily)